MSPYFSFLQLLFRQCYLCCSLDALARAVLTLSKCYCKTWETYLGSYYIIYYLVPVYGPKNYNALLVCCNTILLKSMYNGITSWTILLLLANSFNSWKWLALDDQITKANMSASTGQFMYAYLKILIVGFAVKIQLLRSAAGVCLVVVNRENFGYTLIVSRWISLLIEWLLHNFASTVKGDMVMSLKMCKCFVNKLYP